MRPGVVVLLAVIVSSAARAQTPALAPQFQVNTYTTGAQGYPSVASTASGNFVVAWDSVGQDGSQKGVFARIFGPDGVPLTGEIPVNTTTAGSQFEPSVAADANGNFVVVWESGSETVGRRFDGAGAPIGPEFSVNTFTTSTQTEPSVAMSASGAFAVVWQSFSEDASGFGIVGRRFDGTGAAQGADFVVNTYTTGNQMRPSIAMDPDGGFVVAWESPGQDGDLEGIFGRRFDASGVALSSEFPVNTHTTGRQTRACAAIGADGIFVVAWQSDSQDGDGSGIFARGFDASNEPLGGEFPVNTHTTSDQRSPRIAIGPEGDALIVWVSEGRFGQGSNGIAAQRLEPGGRRLGAEHLLNASGGNFQGAPEARIDPAGQFLLAWQSLGPDGSNFGIFARRGGFPESRAMGVDERDSSGPSNANRVLEPGETAAVEPSWRNLSGAPLVLAGAASEFTGPPGPVYTLEDLSADYGTIPAGETRGCFAASSNCLEMTVSEDPRPATHWDATFLESLTGGVSKTWTLHVGESFADVPTSQLFYRAVESVLHGGITTGCSAAAYCPDDPVTRSQMSLFLARGLAGGGPAIPASGLLGGSPYSCGAGGTSLFADVLPTDIFCRSVHYIAAQNVTLGCAPGLYCPAPEVTRIEMSAFVARAVVAPGGGVAVPLTYGPDPVTGFSYSCDPAGPGTFFTDVPVSSPFCKHAHFLWARGIISGCGATTYCPGDPVTRDAMARFLTNGFAVELYGP
jgi:hypothetical protein